MRQVIIEILMQMRFHVHVPNSNQKRARDSEGALQNVQCKDTYHAWYTDNLFEYGIRGGDIN